MVGWLRRTMDHRVKKAVDFINENYNKPLSLGQLAKEVSLSSFRLEHLLKEEIGKPFKQYLLAFRMRRARELLGDLSLNVSEVAYSVGFNSISNFTHYFKRLFRTTPSSYRKLISEKVRFNK